MTRQTAILTAILAICGVPVAAAEEARDPNALPAPSWGGEIRLHAGGINGDPGIGGTGGPFDTRFSLDAPLARGLRLFGEVGTGGYQGEDDAGLHQLYFSYEHGDEKPVSVRAGYIPVPFGRWDAVTLSRPLIKDYEFTVGAGDEFVLRRASPGVGFHAAAGLFETDLALVDQTSTPRFAVERGDGRDAVARFGLRGGAFSAGVSVLSGLRPGAVAISGGESAEIRSRGVDLQWSRGPFSVGGEAVVVDLAGSRNAGYYVQGSWDASPLVRGLRIFGKYDVFSTKNDVPEETFRRSTIGLRQALRRDLDVDLEADRDRGNGSAPGFGGTHLVFGVRYRF